MTARMMIALEQVFLDERPDIVVVYEHYTPAAAAMVAAKLHIPIAHVEAGLGLSID